jgi:hypothetical protein
MEGILVALAEWVSVVIQEVTLAALGEFLEAMAALATVSATAMEDI